MPPATTDILVSAARSNGSALTGGARELWSRTFRSFLPSLGVAMNIVKLLRSTLGSDPALSDSWFVTNGSGAVGPVALELVARGVEAGKVPLESCFVRHESWKIWRGLSDLAADAPAADLEDESGVFSRSLREDALAQGAPTVVGAEVALADAADLQDALLRLLSTAVERCGADGAILHRVEGDAAIAVSAHGPAMFEVVGARTSLIDPVVMAAAAGLTVIAEPTPGPAGAAMIGRLERLGVAAVSAVMVPIRPGGHLHAMIELGRRTPFRLADVAAIEALVVALVECRFDAVAISTKPRAA